MNLSPRFTAGMSAQCRAAQSLVEVFSVNNFKSSRKPTGLSTGARLLKCGYTLLQKDPIELSLNILQKFNIYMETEQPIVPLLF